MPKYKCCWRYARSYFYYCESTKFEQNFYNDSNLFKKLMNISKTGEISIYLYVCSIKSFDNCNHDSTKFCTREMLERFKHIQFISDDK